MKYHYIGAVLGISHAPGSPFYIVVNWLVAQLPFGELAWRLNLFSAVAAAMASAFLYLSAVELARSRIAALVGAVALLTASVFWEQSIVAEVYTFHAALLLASTWLLVRWWRTEARSDLAAAALLYGLSFGVHLMSWYLLPGWIALVLVGNRSVLRRPREAALVAVGALAGMSTYLYYAVRPAMRPRYVEVDIDSVGAFFDYVTGGDFKQRMFAYDAHAMVTDRWPWFVDLLGDNVGWPLVALATVGFVALARRNWRFFMLLAPTTALAAFYAMGYAVGDARIFALPGLYAIFIAAAVGVDASVASVRSWSHRPIAPVLVSLVLATTVAVERTNDVARNSVVLDRSRDHRYAEYARRILTSVERHATVVAGSDWIFHALAYQHWGVGLRANGQLFLQTAEPAGCDATRQAIVLYLARGPVYGTTGMSACVDGHYDLETVDLSRTLPDYLAAVPAGRIVALATQDTDMTGVDNGAWEALEKLGVLAALRGRPALRYAAVLVRTPLGFAGTERHGDRDASLRLTPSDPISTEVPAPFDVAIHSGDAAAGVAASIVVAGTDTLSQSAASRSSSSTGGRASRSIDASWRRIGRPVSASSATFGSVPGEVERSAAQNHSRRGV